MNELNVNIVTKNTSLDIAQTVLRSEAEAIVLAADRLDEVSIQNFIDLVISKNASKVVVSGVGKSGHVAQKLAATFCSTGTQAVYLHPTDAVHGDLGIYSPGDPTILISKSGATEELVRLIPMLREFHSPIIALVGNTQSSISRAADITFDASVPREADPLSLVPTTSAVLAMAMGDALASVLMDVKGFQKNDFARYHPAGQLGRNLLTKVSDVMHKEQSIAWVKSNFTLRQLAIAMTQHPLGAAIVVDDTNNFEGIITDGDIRRSLEKDINIDTAVIADLMTRNPVHVSKDAYLADAVNLMENRKSQLAVLPVLDDSKKRCIGLIRIHDIYQ